MNKIKKIYKIISKYNFIVRFEEIDDCIKLMGESNNYQDIVNVGLEIANTKIYQHVINEIKLKNYNYNDIKKPTLEDNSLDNKEVDVLIIGAGVVGACVARELSKYKLKTLLVDKEEDVAMHASSRNNGCIHPGIDLSKKSNKYKYLSRSLPIYKKMAEELDIDYHEDGQLIVFNSYKYLIGIIYLKVKSLINKIKDTKFLSKKRLHKLEPNINKNIKYGFLLSSAACICPYELVIALTENAIDNGVEVSLQTYVKSMEVNNKIIKKVFTNRGVILPKVVINCAGVFADDIAQMAGDKFYSIHPRKGQSSILDKNALSKLGNSAIQLYSNKNKNKKIHSKGGCVMPTVDDNVLVGPDAIEVPEKEAFYTTSSSTSNVFKKHISSFNNLNKQDIITTFSGIRACTYEEDFIVSKGKWCNNIIHLAGIQSPGLTAAPAIAIEAVNIVKNILNFPIKNNDKFNPLRKKIVNTRKLSLVERDKLIKINPDYGQIVCRCEEISKGEIIDCLHRSLPCNTVDGVKRRVRASMGRCQGGFCQPLIAAIISQEKNIELEDVIKKGEGHIVYGNTK